MELAVGATAVRRLSQIVGFVFTVFSPDIFYVDLGILFWVGHPKLKQIGI